MTQKSIVRSIVVITLAMVAAATWRDARESAHPPVSPTLARALVAGEGGRPSVEATTRDDLQRTVSTMEARLQKNSSDGDAAVQLAGALIRLQRVDSDANAVIKAEQHLRVLLSRLPNHYDAQRMLGNVLLSQHRFRDAIREAQRAREIEPRDAWNDGVLGDAHLELGEYDDAFAAFDRMSQLRPGPTA